MQSEIAQLVAGEIEAIITPEEKQLIEIVPTTSLTALDYYQEAQDNLWEWQLSRNTVALQRAENLYYKALENDSTFAQVYIGLAMIYWNKHEAEEYLTESYLDSVLILTDIASSHNPNLSEIYLLRGRYYGAINNFEQAFIEYDKALDLNSNEWMAYLLKAELYAYIDNLEFIKNLHKAVTRNRGEELSFMLRLLSQAYKGIVGFEKQGLKYAQQYMDLTGDSAWYFQLLASGINYSGEKIALLQEAYRLDSSDIGIISSLGESYSFLDNHQESLKYFEKCLETGNFGANRYHRIGYALSLIHI